jgi:hypothetical protein
MSGDTGVLERPPIQKPAHILHDKPLSGVRVPAPVSNYHISQEPQAIQGMGLQANDVMPFSSEVTPERPKTPAEILSVLPENIRKEASVIFEAIDIIQDPDFDFNNGSIFEGKLPSVNELRSKFSGLEYHLIHGDNVFDAANLIARADEVRELRKARELMLEILPIKKAEAEVRAVAEREDHAKALEAAKQAFEEANEGNVLDKHRRRQEIEDLHMAYTNLEFQTAPGSLADREAKNFSYEIEALNMLKDPLEIFVTDLVASDKSAGLFNRFNISLAEGIKNEIEQSVSDFTNLAWEKSPLTHLMESQALKALSQKAVLQVIDQALEASNLPPNLRQELGERFSGRLAADIAPLYINYDFLLSTLDHPDILKYLPLTIPGNEDYLDHARAFWRFVGSFPNFMGQDSNILGVLKRNYDRFSDYVVDGEKTPAYFKLIAKECPQAFIQTEAGRDQWKLIVGDEAVNKFLDALPTETDEKRNAFTHNQYDRTSEFLLRLARQNRFALTPDDLEFATGYVREFGLSNNSVLYDFYKNLQLLGQGKIDSLPQEMVDSGIISVDTLRQKLDTLRAKIYSQEELTDSTGLSEVDRKFLEYLTGYSSHKFSSGRPDMNQILEDFKQNYESGAIKPVPDGYAIETISIPKIRIDFDPTAIEGDYAVLKDEILSSIENSGQANDLASSISQTIQAKIDEITRILPTVEGGQRKFMEQSLSQFQDYVSQINGIEDIDTLVTTLIDMKFDKSEVRSVNSVLRQAVFRKIIAHQLSPEMVNDLESRLRGGITPESMLGIINLVDHVAKAHVLDLAKNNQDGYWKPEAFEKLKASKRGRNLAEIFESYGRNLRKAVDDFEVINTGGADDIKIIPDRGLIGEMSGYLADVCYTKEYPLLVKYPNVIPYKFVQGEGADVKFIGSVLIFEVADVEGNQSLLVRALDIPDEKSVDIGTFTEKLLDSMQQVALRRGFKQVLVSGTSGTISNYQMTTNHVLGKYVLGHKPVTLSEVFNFNDHDLTRETYLARTVTVPPEV